MNAFTSRMGKSLRFAVLALALAPAFAAGGCGKPTANAAGFSLTVMHTNDMHSAYGGTNASGMFCYAPLCEGGRGGSVRMQQASRAVRQDRPDAIFLDAGDVFQGTLYWASHKETMPAALLDAMEYQAIIPGNHEFDDGCKPFLEEVRALKTPVTAANLFFDPPLEGAALIRPWVVIERSGRKIGIVGIANTQTVTSSSPCPEARFADETETLRVAVNELTAQGVNIIIALTHIGLENDKRLARSVAGVDIIVGGHSHSLLSNTLPKAEGPYPLVERSPEGRPVLIVTAAAAAAYLGRLDVRFDDAGVPLSWQGEPIVLDDASLREMKAPAPDPELSAMIENFSEPVRRILREPLGAISAEGKDGKPLDEPGVLLCRAAECLTGDIVADALLSQVFNGAQAAVVNSGALRNSLPGGRVNVGDILVALPFQNRPVMADMTGSVLLRALEHGVAGYDKKGGAFLQTAGLRYAFDPGKEPGKRIVKAEIRDKSGSWSRVRADTSYKVATVDFLAGGGDGFAMLRPLKWQKAAMLMSDALRLHLQKNSPLTPKLEGRIRRVNKP